MAGRKNPRKLPRDKSPYHKIWTFLFFQWVYTIYMPNLELFPHEPIGQKSEQSQPPDESVLTEKEPVLTKEEMDELYKKDDGDKWYDQ
jgi:hypothetical protein